MVIDKTTGRGCALSMASKTVTKELVADGIVGKPIYRKLRMNSKRNYDLFRAVKFKHNKYVYVMSQKDGGVDENPLWTPSFLDAGIWEQAVSKFPSSERLDQSVEKYLLPKMDEYLQGISDAELVSLTRDLLMEHGVINKPVCQHNGKTYYFDENGVYSLDKKAERFPYEGRQKFNIFKITCETCFNMNVWSKAASQFKAGMTLDECIGIFLQTELAHNVPQKPTPVDRLIQSISSPIYECVPGNDNRSAFDRIRITVGLPRYQFNSWEALQNEVKTYQREIFRRVVQRLEQDRQFKRYGIPINFLTLSNVMLLRDYSIEFIFEPKVTTPPDM